MDLLVVCQVLGTSMINHLVSIPFYLAPSGLGKKRVAKNELKQ
jgi:hypothetical protein